MEDIGAFTTGTHDVKMGGTAGPRGRGRGRGERGTAAGPGARGMGRGQQKRVGPKATFTISTMGNKRQVGAQKQPIRTMDQEGDQQMRNTLPHKRAFKPIFKPTSWILITGYDIERTKEQQLRDLFDKLSTPVQVLKSSMRGKEAFFKLGAVDQATAAKQELNGQRFFTRSLRVDYAPEKDKDVYNEPAFQLEMDNLVQQRYDAANKSLVLSNLAGDHNGTAYDFNRYPFVRNILTAAQTRFPETTTVFFDNDNMSSLKSIKDLTKFLPNVVNLSFAGNPLVNFNELNYLQGIKLNGLILTGTPLRTKHDNTIYQNEIQKIFPKLAVLDGQPVTPLINFGVSTSQTKETLPPIKDSFYTNRETAESFLQQYFNIFDSGNRQDLLNYYTTNASFSLSLTIEPGQGSTRPYHTQMFFNNRNLLSNQVSEKRVAALKSGREEIVKFLCTLPKTKFLYEEGFRIDSFILNFANSQVLSINIHGSFVELDKNKLKRSFDRTFLLIPNQGINPVVIINDMMHIRNQMPLPPVTEAPPTQFSQPAPPIAALSTLPSVNLNPLAPQTIDASIVERLMALTHLKRNWAERCLIENKWNFDAAVEAFTRLRNENQITAEMLQ